MGQIMYRTLDCGYRVMKNSFPIGKAWKVVLGYWYITEYYHKACWNTERQIAERDTKEQAEKARVDAIEQFGGELCYDSSTTYKKAYLAKHKQFADERNSQ